MLFAPTSAGSQASGMGSVFAAISAPVTTASTPGSSSAALVSTERMSAWANGLRNTATWAISGRSISATIVSSSSSTPAERPVGYHHPGARSGVSQTCGTRVIRFPCAWRRRLEAAQYWERARRALEERGRPVADVAVEECLEGGANSRDSLPGRDRPDGVVLQPGRNRGAKLRQKDGEVAEGVVAGAGDEEPDAGPVQARPEPLQRRIFAVGPVRGQKHDRPAQPAADHGP